LRYCSSGLKVQIPGLDGTMSVNFLFILLGVLELSLPQTLLIGCTATLVQCLWQARQKIVPAKVVFNVFMMANAIALSFLPITSGKFLGEKTPCCWWSRGCWLTNPTMKTTAALHQVVGKRPDSGHSGHLARGLPSVSEIITETGNVIARKTAAP